MEYAVATHTLETQKEAAAKSLAEPATLQDALAKLKLAEDEVRATRNELAQVRITCAALEHRLAT